MGYKCKGCNEVVYEAYDCHCDEVVIQLREQNDNLKDILKHLFEDFKVWHLENCNRKMGICYYCKATQAIQ